MTDVNTPEGRKALRELCDRATPGPWEQSHGGSASGGLFQITKYYVRTSDEKVNDIAIAADIVDPYKDEPSKENAAFIAAAREAVPALLDALDASERVCNEIDKDHSRLATRGEELYDRNIALQSENAALKAENERLNTYTNLSHECELAALRAQVEALERVREAAVPITQVDLSSFTGEAKYESYGMDVKLIRLLRAALAGAKGEG